MIIQLEPPSRLHKFLLFCAISCALLLSACSESTSPDKTKSQAAQQPTLQTNQNKPKSIALVMKTLTNPFFIEMERGARLAEKELGISLLVKTAAQETSIQQQISIVDELIRMKVDAIVIAPGDSIELIPVLKQAQDEGIIVINIDNRLDPEYSKLTGLSNVPFISVDNKRAAYFSAKTLADKIKEPSSVAIIEGIRRASNAQERKNGAIAAFDEQPLANIVAMETANWKIDEAFEVSKQIFNKHSDIKALFCANDMMALGAIKYLQSTGRNDVLVAGFDALEQAKSAIRAGKLVATVDQQAAEQGYQGILFAHRALAAEKLPKLMYIDTKILTIENIN